MQKEKKREKEDSEPQQDNCPSCGSTEFCQTEEDISCNNCGRVLENSFFSEGYGAYHEESDKHYNIKEKDDFNLNTVISSPNLQKTLQNTISSTHSEKVVYKNSKIHDICIDMHLGKEIENRSQEIYIELNSKEKGLTVVSKKLEYLCSIVYCASKINDKTKLPIEFCTQYSLNEKKLKSYISKINKILPQNEIDSENLLTTQKSNFARKIANTFNLDPKIIEKIVKKTSEISKNHPSTKSKTIASIVIYYEMNKANISVLMKDVIKQCGVTETAVYKFKKKLLENNELKF